MFEHDGNTYLSITETAQVLGMHPGSVRRWHSDGTAPFVGLTIGPSRFYKAADVKAYLREHGSPGRGKRGSR